MPQLEQDDGQVVDEEQGVDQREGELHDVPVLDLVAVLEQVDAVEQPEGDEEHEHEEGDQGAEHEDPGQRRLGFPEEHGPRPDEKDEEFESKTDEHSVTSHITVKVESPRLGVKHPEVGQDHHQDGAEEGGDGETGRGQGPEVLLTSLLQAPPGRYLPLGQILFHRVLNV